MACQDLILQQCHYQTTSRGCFIDVKVNWDWKPYAVPPAHPFKIREECAQGHSNQVADPYSLHHALTFYEAISLGWIFLVTDASNRRSIEQRGPVLDVKGTGRGGRDSAHFMDHNGNSPGYIRMADNTAPPRNLQKTNLLCSSSFPNMNSYSSQRMGSFWFTVM